MVRTRNNGKKNLVAFSRKKVKNAEENAQVPWANLCHDLLFLILMRLGVIDFITFSGVCKTWRSFALSHRERFMASKEPLTVVMSTHAKRACSLVDTFNGRRYRTSLPDFSGRSCVGLACGYLIMFGRRTHDFWLVNPVTRHELKFPNLPSPVPFQVSNFRAILVFSPSLASFVFVISFRSSSMILFSASGNADWSFIPCKLVISDIHAFKGKMYVLGSDGDLGEMKLFPIPTLMLLKDKQFRFRSRFPDFVSSSEKLFILDFRVRGLYDAFEVDANNMQLVKTGKMEGYALFLGVLKCDAAVDFRNWPDPGKHRRKSTYFLASPLMSLNFPLSSFIHALSVKGVTMKEVNQCTNTSVWYFPSDCYTVNLLHE